jgi:hypothetical protein
MWMEAKAILVLVVKEEFQAPFCALKLPNPSAGAFTTQLLQTTYRNDVYCDNASMV